MIKKITTLLLCFIALSHVAYAADVDLDIDGVSGDLKDNVEAYLSDIDEADYSTSLRFQSRLTKPITKALQALGYYHAKIHYTVSDDNETLTVHIDPQDPVTIELLDIVITGEAKSDPDFIQLIKDSPLKQGVQLNHSQYDGLKSSLRNLALKKGYFDGDFTQTQLAVIPELNQAQVHLHYQSGIRYHFGPVVVKGSQIRENRVDSLKPFKTGDPYLVSKVGQYNQNLSNTDWFDSVFVSPDLDKVGESRSLPMTVSLSPQSQNQIETGIGYSTDVGVRGTLKWKKPWVNDLGHSFSSSLSVSKPEQMVTASYKIPLEDVLHEYYEIKSGLKHVDNRDTKSFESNVALERHWIAENGWHKTLFIRYLYEQFTQGLVEDGVQFVLPGVSLSRTRTRGGQMPMWGDKQSVTVEYGDPNFFSATQVTRVLGRTAWIRSIGENHRGFFRVDGGANFADDFNKLPPSLRFFTGGNNSLRGYSYQSVSPKDSSGALTGAKYIATSTLEYQYRIHGRWWLATFYDYGDAFNDTPEWKSGTGFGIRWGSPVGPVRLDFAWGLDADPGDEFQIHFSLGPEL